MTAPALELRGITKRFGPTLANDRVDLTAHASEIHALLGENGAGKSTLMSILAGRYQPDAGEIFLDGDSVRFASSAEALARGVGMVHQRFMLVEALTVAENILLATGGGFLPDIRGETARIAELAERFSLEADPARRVADLSMGERQRVEILKLLRLGARILIFDEPTSVLTPGEAKALGRVLAALRGQGRAIVLITHKLDEALELADRISILRRGRLVASTTPAEAGGKASLARMMVGREVIFDIAKTPVPPGPEVLAATGLTGGGESDRPAFADVTFRLRRGEILAVVGVAGNGQTELAEALAGLAPCREGAVEFLGERFAAARWSSADKAGLVYLPEDRHHEACLPGQSLLRNFMLTRLDAYRRGPGLDWRQAREDTVRALHRHAIAARGPGQPAGELSGGNLQKFVLARELSREPKVLLVHQPTQGLDVGASEDVWRLLLAARERAGVLLVTGDLAEALTLADRVAVIFRGRILGVVNLAAGEDPGRIGPLMAGVAA